MAWKWFSINKTFCFLLQCWKIYYIDIEKFCGGNRNIGIFQGKFDFLFKSFDEFDKGFFLQET